MKHINKHQDYLIVRGSILHNTELKLNEKLFLSKLIELWINCPEIKISNSKIMEYLQISYPTLVSIKARLKGLGLIDVESNFNEEGGQTSNTYILNETNINEFLGTELFEVDKKQSNSNEEKETTTSGSEILENWGKIMLGRYNGKYYAVYPKEDGRKPERLGDIAQYNRIFSEFGINGVELYNDVVIMDKYGER